MGKALKDLLAYQRPTREGVDATGQAYSEDLPANGLVERAANYVRKLHTRVQGELKSRAERFETLLSSGSPLDQLRQTACERVSAAFSHRERTLGDGIVWSRTRRRDAADGGILRPTQVVIPNALRIEQCVSSLDHVRWYLPDIVPTLDGLIGLNVEPPFSGLEDVRAFKDAVWAVWTAEKEDHIWGCFLLTQCGTAFEQGSDAYQQLVAKIGRNQEAAVKETASYLASFMPQRRGPAEADAANDEESPRALETDEQEPEFYTPPKLAERWGVDDEKVLRYIRSGELRAINLATEPSGRPRWHIALSDILAFERNRMNAPPPTPTARTKPPKDDDTIKFY